MPVIATVRYLGGLRTEAAHLQSGTRIETDAPLDNNGRGERFSPTDLVAAALASCMLTVMGILADRSGWDITGTDCDVTKIMVPDPRRIGEIRVELRFPADGRYDAKARQMLERAALTCPVFESLHPDLKKTILFHWPAADNA